MSVSRLRKALLRQLPKEYEDGEVVVYKGLTTEEATVIVLGLLEKARRPVSLRTLKKVLSGTVSEDKLRIVLRRLEYEGKVVRVDRSRYIASKFIPSETGTA